LILLLLGLPLLAAGATVTAGLQAFPRSKNASFVCFGAGAAWFLYHIWNLSPADFGDYRVALFIGFTLIAILAFKCVPDFLAVRGVCILALLGAMPLLDAAYMQYTHPQRLWMVSLVYLVIVLALWIGTQPWRLRDFLGWLLARPGRPRCLGGVLAAYGLLLAVLAFTY